MGCYSGRNMKYLILSAHLDEGQLHLSSMLLALMLACCQIIVPLDGGDRLDLARSIPNTRLLVGLEWEASLSRLKNNNCWERILASVPHLKGFFFVFFYQTRVFLKNNPVRLNLVVTVELSCQKRSISMDNFMSQMNQLAECSTGVGQISPQVKTRLWTFWSDAFTDPCYLEWSDRLPPLWNQIPL